MILLTALSKGSCLREINSTSWVFCDPGQRQATKKVDTDDIIQRLTDHGLYTKQERNALFIEARDEIAALQQYVLALLRSSGRTAASPEMIDAPGSLEYPEPAIVCADLYQVVGCLAGEFWVFSHPDVQRALENASKHKLVHRDLLPWPKRPLRPVTEA